MFSIVDLETTGFGPTGNRITEISVFIHDGEKVVDEFTTLVDPECAIPYRITSITGIDNEMVQGKPKFYEIAKKVHLMTEGTVFVAHNVSFDYGVLRKEYASLGGEFKRKKLCTVRMSRKLIPEAPRYSLGNLCGFLGIEIKARHRARGDAEATVQLFEHLRTLDNGHFFENALGARSRHATLPPHLKRETFDSIPKTSGVYYFKNDIGKDIYIGKAKNLRQRVLSHFYGKGRKDVRMFGLIHDVTYEETGSELLALLLESEEIKMKYPLYNTAQKRQVESYALVSFENRKGLIQLAHDKSDRVKHSPMRFYSVSQARGFIETLCEEFELCPKYCNLQSSNGACFNYGLKKCKGVCAGKEAEHEYNARVRAALESIPQLQADLIIREKGRSSDEYGFALISGGVYKGIGFLPKNEWPDDKKDLLSYLRPMHDNRDVHRILRQYLRKEGEKDLFSIRSGVMEHID